MKSSGLILTRSLLCRRHGHPPMHRTFGANARSIDDVTSDYSTLPSVTHVHSFLSSGLLDYNRGWAWQQTLLSRRLELRRQSESDVVMDPDCVLLFQHRPVYTLGRGADEMHLTFLQEQSASQQRERLARTNRGIGSARLSVDRRLDTDLLTRPLKEAVDVLSGASLFSFAFVFERSSYSNLITDISTPVMAPNGVPIYRVERGGEVTFHGPGQLVVYPLFDLRRWPLKQDLHWYLRMVEEVVIMTLREYGIDGHRCQVNTGVWVGDFKVAAIGVTSSRWITTHGFALNINPDLTYFDTSNILPCGIEGKGVTSVEEIIKQRGESEIPTLEDVGAVVLRHLQQVFGIEMKGAESLC